MGRGKQITVLALIALLLLGCVYLGIQIKNKPAPPVDDAPYQGSYKETSISLPVINKEGGEEFLQLLRGLDDTIELYTILYNEDRSMVRGYNKYTLNSELKWDSADADWMALEYFADTTLQVRMLAYADTGSVYFLVHDLAAAIPVNDDIVRVGSEGKPERINVRGLYKTDKEERPIQIKTFFIKDNMICFTDELSNSYAYSLANGTLFASGTNASFGSIASDGEYLYLLDKGFDAIIPYSIENGKETGSLPLLAHTAVYSGDENSYGQMDYRLLSHDNLLYLSCQDGIFSYNFASGAWQQLMGGLDCVFGRPSITGESLVATGDSLYMFSKDTSGNRYLTMYSRRTEEEDEKLRRSDFTILSYERSAIITEAAGAFQHSNPSLLVRYRVAREEDPSISVDSYRTQVQRELQGENTIDILVCDELDYQSYMDSGLFENISDLMKPLYTSAGLYGNVTNAMAQTKIFVTPAKFDIFLIYGAKGIVENSKSFDGLAALSERLKQPVLGSMTAEELAVLLGSFYEETFLVDHRINKEALLQMLTLLPSVVKLAEKPDGTGDGEPADGTAADGTQGDGTAQEDVDGWFGIPSSPGTAGIARISSGTDFLAFLTALKDPDIAFSDAIGHFIPRNIVGINSKSSSIKTSKEFLRTLYSDSVQQAGVGPGIPMQLAAVEASLQDVATTENLAQLTACLEAANTVYTENAGLREALASILTPYLKGEITAEEAAAGVMDYTPSVMTLN